MTMNYFTSENIIFYILIAIPLFFLLRWTLKKFINADRYRLVTTIGATLTLTLIIYLVLIYLFIIAITYEPSRDFDKNRWLTDRTDRFEMANHIISSKMLIGKDTNQVKKLIGDPTWRSEQIQQWSYDMGQGGGGLGFLFHNLVIKFDREKVVSVDHAKIRD